MNNTLFAQVSPNPTTHDIILPYTFKLTGLYTFYRAKSSELNETVYRSLYSNVFNIDGYEYQFCIVDRTTTPVFDYNLRISLLDDPEPDPDPVDPDEPEPDPDPDIPDPSPPPSIDEPEQFSSISLMLYVWCSNTSNDEFKFGPIQTCNIHYQSTPLDIDSSEQYYLSSMGSISGGIWQSRISISQKVYSLSFMGDIDSSYDLTFPIDFTITLR